MSFPDFSFLKGVFDKFAKGRDLQDLSLRAARSLAAGGKAISDHARQEFPQELVRDVTADIYAALTGQEMSDGLSRNIRALDEQTIRNFLDTELEKLKTEERAREAAVAVKWFLQKNSAADIEGYVDKLISGRNFAERLLYKTLFNRIIPLVNDMRDGSVAEVTQKIQLLADTMPTDVIARLAAALTREATPECVSKQMADAVQKMPSPQIMAEMAHDVAAVTSSILGRAAGAATQDDLAQALRDLADAAVDIKDQAMVKDKAVKKAIPRNGKKGGR